MRCCIFKCPGNGTIQGFAVCPTLPGSRTLGLSGEYMITRVRFSVIPGCGPQYGYKSFEDLFKDNFGLFRQIGEDTKWFGGGSDPELNFHIQADKLGFIYLHPGANSYEDAERWFLAVNRHSFFRGLQVEEYSTTIRPALLARGQQASDDDASYYEGTFTLYVKTTGCVTYHSKVFSNGDGVDVSLEVPHYRAADLERESQEESLEAYLKTLKDVDFNARLTMATRHLILANRKNDRGYFNRALKALYKTIGGELPKLDHKPLPRPTRRKN